MATRDVEGHFVSEQECGAVLRILPLGEKTRCRAWGCSRKPRAKGLCIRHYCALRRAQRSAQESA